MIFSNNNFDVPILKIRDEQLESVDKIKFLGVIVDSKLRITDHIKGVCSKVARVCGIFNRLLFIPPNVRRTMNFSLAYPYLIYAIEVWGCASGVLIDQKVDFATEQSSGSRELIGACLLIGFTCNIDCLNSVVFTNYAAS